MLQPQFQSCEGNHQDSYLHIFQNQQVLNGCNNISPNISQKQNATNQTQSIPSNQLSNCFYPHQQNANLQSQFQVFPNHNNSIPFTQENLYYEELFNFNDKLNNQMTMNNQINQIYPGNSNSYKDNNNISNSNQVSKNRRQDISSPQQPLLLNKSQSEQIQYNPNLNCNSFSNWQQPYDIMSEKQNPQDKSSYYNFKQNDIPQEFFRDFPFNNPNTNINLMHQASTPASVAYHHTDEKGSSEYNTNNCKNINNYNNCQFSNNLNSTSQVANIKKNSQINIQQQQLQNNSILSQADLKKLKMAEFKVHACTKRDKHEKKKCPYFHNDGDRRRCPEKYKYSFNECKKKDKCLLKDDCPQVHNKVEQLYHPLRYKAKFCESYKENNQKCEYGNFCSFAHNNNEIVIPMICKLKRDQIFYMYFYKTVWCPNTQKHERAFCPYMHNVQDFRRDPKTFYLEPKQCEQWKKTNISKYSEGECTQQLKCTNCHGWKEYDYHPSVYKTKPCNLENCPQNLECVLYHSDEDKRIITPQLLKQEEDQAREILQSLMKQEIILCHQDVKLGAPIDVFYNETEENIIQTPSMNINCNANRSNSSNNNMNNNNTINSQKNRVKSNTINNQSYAVNTQQQGYHYNRQTSNSQSGINPNQYNPNYNKNQIRNSNNQRHQDQNRQNSNNSNNNYYNNNKSTKQVKNYNNNNNNNTYYQAINNNTNNQNNIIINNNNGNQNMNNINNKININFNNNINNDNNNNYSNNFVPINFNNQQNQNNNTYQNQNLSNPTSSNTNNNNNINHDIQNSYFNYNGNLNNNNGFQKQSSINSCDLFPNNFNNFSSSYQNNLNFCNFGPSSVNNKLDEYNEVKSAYSSNTEQTSSNYAESRGSSVEKSDFDGQTIINKGTNNPLIISPTDINVQKYMYMNSYSSSKPQPISNEFNLSRKNSISELHKYFERKMQSDLYEVLIQNKYNDNEILKLIYSDIPQPSFLTESQKIILRNILDEYNDEQQQFLDIQQLLEKS